MEYVTRHKPERKNFIIKVSFYFLFILSIWTIKLIWTPSDYESHHYKYIAYYRTYVTVSTYLTIIVSTMIILVCVAVCKKIPLKLTLDKKTNTFKILFIDRFKNNPTEKEINLKRLSYYIDEWPDKNSKKFKILKLNHPDIGTINLNQDDMDELMFRDLEFQLRTLKNYH